MGIRKARKVLSKPLTGGNVTETLIYTPTNGTFFTLYLWVDDISGATHNDITIEVVKQFAGGLIDPAAIATATLTIAQQTGNQRAFISSDTILPPALGESYEVNITSVATVDNLTLNLHALEA